MSFSPKYLRPILTLLIIAGFIFLAYKGYCYYEDPNEDGYCAILMRGDFTGGPQTLPNSSGFWTGLTYLVKDMYLMEPNTDWYAVFMTAGYGLLIFQIAQIIPFLYSGLKNTGGKWVAITVLVICGILFTDNLLLWQLTRLSLLLSGLSLFKIWLNLRNTANTFSKKWGSYLFNLLCFTYAASIRSEPAALNLVIWLPLMLLDYMQGVPLKRYTLFIPLIFIIGVVSFIINRPVNDADRNYMAFRKYQFSFFDYKQPVGTLRINGPGDSMIYKAATTAFLSDSAKLNTAFFNRIGMMPMDKTPSAIPYYFSNLPAAPAKIKRACEKLLSANPGIAFFYIFCFFTGLLVVLAFNSKKISWYLLSQFWYIALIIAITAFMKMENRVLIPAMWCFLIQNMVWCSAISGSRTGTSKQATMMTLMFIIVGLAAVASDSSKMYKRWKSKHYEELQADLLVKRLNAQAGNIIVVNDNACSKLAIRPFKSRYVFEDKKVVCLNYFQLFWLAQYGPYMQSVCGKSDFPGIVKALYEQKSNVVFVSKPPRMELIKEYFKVLYNTDLPYAAIDTLVKTNNSNLKNSEVNLYRFI